MVTKNKYDNSWTMEKDEMVNDEWLTLNVSHVLDQKDPSLSGWFACILTHDEETGDVDWGFAAGYAPSYPEVIAKLKASPSYNRYPFPI